MSYFNPNEPLLMNDFISSKPCNEQGILAPEGLIRSFAELLYSNGTTCSFKYVDNTLTNVELRLRFDIPDASVGISFKVLDDNLEVSNAWGRQLMFGYGYVDFDFKQFAKNMWGGLKASEMFTSTE
jgi:hypothetical protein